MSRAPRLDLRYEHEVRTAPAPAAQSPHPLLEAGTLVARLRCLKALMDAERGHLAAWIAARPSVVLS